MAVDVWRSTPTKVANWSAVAVSPDITFVYDAQGSSTHLYADILGISQSGGGRDIEGIKCFGAKTITREKPVEDVEISMDIAMTTTRWDSMLMGTTYAAGTEIKYTSRKKWRIIITWQDPDALVETSAERLRWIFKDVYAVTFEPEHSADEYAKGTITFKVPAFDKSGNSNIIKQYITTGSLTTLGAAHGGAEGSYT